MTGWKVTGDAPESIPPEEMAKIARAFHMPGEKVRLIIDRRFAGEDPDQAKERASIFGDKVVVVEELEIETMAGTGTYRPLYRLKGIDGMWPANAFGDERPTRNAYGIVTEMEGDLWFAEINHEDTEGRPVIVADPIPLVDDLSSVGQRFFTDAYNVDSAAGVTQMLKSELCDEFGCSGEFTFRQNDDGQWHVDGISWTSGVSEKEKEAVDDRIRSLKSSATGPSFR